MAKLDTQFFYDRQLSTRDTSIRIFHDSTLIARAILQSGYGYTITNTWGSEGGIMGALMNLGVDLANSFTGPTSNLVLDGLEGFGVDPNGNFMQQARKYTNAHFYSAADKVKSFGGTTVAFNGTDSVTILLIADKDDADLQSQLATLTKFAIGAKEDDTAIWGWVGIQFAPNGYQWTSDSIDLTKPHIDRTLTMFVGNMLIIDNLLVESMKVDISPQNVMKPYSGRKPYENINSGDTQQSYKNYIFGESTRNPLYISVTLDFTYARMITTKDINRIFISGEDANKGNDDQSVGIVNTNFNG